MSTKPGTKLRILLLTALVGASAAMGAYVSVDAQEIKVEKPVGTAAKPAAKNALSDEERVKLKAEFTKMRQEEYLRMVQEQEKFYRAMADEMKEVYKACRTDDKDACKKAKTHAKLTRADYSDARKKNSKRFEEKADEYRRKLGDGQPTDVENERAELKAKKKAQ